MSLLGIDIGTSNCKGAVLSEDGKCVARAYKEYALVRPRRGFVEVDSRLVVAIGFDIIRKLAISARDVGSPVQAISISAMGEAVTPVSEDRKIIGNAIHHSDTRGRAEIDLFLAKIPLSELYAINPNIVSTAYSLVKLLWWQTHKPELYRKTDKFLFFGDLFFYLLGCEAVTSFSQANRTLLFDLNNECWSRQLLGLSDIDPSCLPRPVPSGHIAGRVSAAAAAPLGLESGVLCIVGAHDQCCNALGAGIISAGKAVDGIGTVECITPVFSRIPDKSAMLKAGLHIEHHAVPGLYVSFVYNQAGSLVKWFRDTFAQGERGPQAEDLYDRLASELPCSPTRLLVLPHFEPTGAPSYIEASSGVILGLRTSTERGEILKAIMECETFYFLEAAQTLSELGIDTSHYVATGGGAKSSAWLQIKADIMGVSFERPSDPEAGVLGAVIIASKAVGSVHSYEEVCAHFIRPGRVFELEMSRHRIYREKFEKYRQIFPRLKELLGNVA